MTRPKTISREELLALWHQRAPHLSEQENAESFDYWQPWIDVYEDADGVICIRLMSKKTAN